MKDIRNNITQNNVKEATFYIASIVGIRYVNEKVDPEQGFLHDMIVFAVPNEMIEESDLKEAAVYAFCEAYSDIVTDENWRFQVEMQKLSEIVQHTNEAVKAMIRNNQFEHVRKALKVVD